MSSGRGILHEELPKAGLSGVINGFQLWVNLPAAEKLSQPRYQEIVAKNIPVYQNEGVQVRVVAGDYAGVQGAVTDIAAQPLYMEVNLDAGMEFSLPVPAGHTLVVYLFEGEALFGKDAKNQGEFVSSVRMVIFENGDHLTVQSGLAAPARFMVMAGAPFHEPIVPYGPFVMNTEAEIQQAFIDLRNGTFVK
jgi:redox-sensitive bicupin YhaK (pirin superfamily)